MCSSMVLVTFLITKHDQSGIFSSFSCMVHLNLLSDKTCIIFHLWICQATAARCKWLSVNNDVNTNVSKCLCFCSFFPHEAG